MSYRILLVEPDEAAGSEVVRVLTDTGHRVAWVDTFADALWLSATDAPDMMIAALRLGAYNGLHLLMQVRAHDPSSLVIIACDDCDYTTDISRFGARHVAKPIDPLLLTSAVSELIQGCRPHDPTGARVWPRKPTQLQATVQDATARVVELSYGGVRLNLHRPLERARTPVEISLPSLGVSVHAIARWVRPADDGGSWWCGAEVALPTPTAARTWRRVVASLV
jgi:DNA-binding response OmpR family regulator